jgi:hypothetical protein
VRSDTDIVGDALLRVRRSDGWALLKDLKEALQNGSPEECECHRRLYPNNGSEKIELVLKALSCTYHQDRTRHDGQRARGWIEPPGATAVAAPPTHQGGANGPMPHAASHAASSTAQVLHPLHTPPPHRAPPHYITAPRATALDRLPRDVPPQVPVDMDVESATTAQVPSLPSHCIITRAACVMYNLHRHTVVGASATASRTSMHGIGAHRHAHGTHTVALHCTRMIARLPHASLSHGMIRTCRTRARPTRDRSRARHRTHGDVHAIATRTHPALASHRPMLSAHIRTRPMLSHTSAHAPDCCPHTRPMLSRVRPMLSHTRASHDPSRTRAHMPLAASRIRTHCSCARHVSAHAAHAHLSALHGTCIYPHTSRACIRTRRAHAHRHAHRSHSHAHRHAHDPHTSHTAHASA